MRSSALALALVVAAGGLAACSSNAKTYSSQCAFIIGDGTGDDRGLKDIVYPSETLNLGDDLARFVPCNARDYVVANRDENRDRKEPTIVKTGKGPNGEAPTELAVYWSAYWQLNQNKETLTAFLPFCEKYGCYSSEDEISGDNNFATDGWVGMLNQSISPASDRAIADAFLKAPPDVWDNRSAWADVAEDVQAVIQAQLRTVTRSGEFDYFCGGGDTRASADNCAPITYVMDAMRPTDPRVEQQQKDAKAIDSATDLTEDRITQNKKLYADQWNYWTGLQDTLRTCKETGQQCQVIIGNPQSIPGFAPTTQG